MPPINPYRQVVRDKILSIMAGREGPMFVADVHGMAVPYQYDVIGYQLRGMVRDGFLTSTKVSGRAAYRVVSKALVGRKHAINQIWKREPVFTELRACR